MIDLSDNKMAGALDLAESFAKLTHLKSINLSGNQIATLQLQMGLLNLPHLQTLNLANNKITQINVNHAPAVAGGV